MGNPISEAVRNGSLEKLRKLLEDKSLVERFINSPNDTGDSPLSVAINNMSYERAKALLDTDCVDIESRNLRGETPLWLAVHTQDPALVQLLLSKKANANTQDKQGRTPLSWAVCKEEGNTTASIIDLLLKHHADPDIMDNEHQTSFLHASSHATRLLLLPPDSFRRRLIVCCDGTWNDRETKQPLTNVSRILSCLETVDRREYGRIYQQIPFYIDGIGTGTRTSRGDAATGKGIERKIREAYRFLCSTYIDRHDQIVLVGFSRGAYTIQCLAKLINDIGLINSEWVNTEFPKIFDLWSTGDGGNPFEGYDLPKDNPFKGYDLPQDNPFEEYDLSEDEDDSSLSSYEGETQPPTKPLINDDEDNSLKGRSHRLCLNGQLRYPISINAYAAWDTVKALGPPKHPITDGAYAVWDTTNYYITLAAKKTLGFFWPWKSDEQQNEEQRSEEATGKGQYMFVNEELPPNIKHAFHAMALDERRYSFEPLTLRIPHFQDLKQCWFLGTHGDIGGGCDNSGLANISLCWMVSQLKGHVKFSQNACWYAADDGSILRNDINKSNEGFSGGVDMYESFTGRWRLGGSAVRIVGRPSSRSMIPALKSHETIHFTVRALSAFAQPKAKSNPSNGDSKSLGPEMEQLRKEYKSVDFKLEPLELKSKPIEGFKCYTGVSPSDGRLSVCLWTKTVNGETMIIPEDCADLYELGMLHRWIDRDYHFSEAVGKDLSNKGIAGTLNGNPCSIPLEWYINSHPFY